MVHEGIPLTRALRDKSEDHWLMKDHEYMKENKYNRKADP